MKIKSSERLREIIKEEVLNHFSSLLEFSSEEDENVIDSDEHNKDKEDKAKSKEKEGDKKSKEKPPEKHGGDELQSTEDDLENDSKGRGIGDRISGLTILSFTVEPKPMTGKTELVLQFKQDPDPLRIIIMPSGDVMFRIQRKND